MHVYTETFWEENYVDSQTPTRWKERTGIFQELNFFADSSCETVKN